MQEKQKNLSVTLPFGPQYPWLAPLAGHSDLPFRILCREWGAAVACTEMVSAKGLVYGERSRKSASASAELLLTTPLAGFPAAEEADNPLVVQLFGEDPNFLGEAVELLAKRGFCWFDLNLGCSVPKVLRAGAGAALARDKERTLRAAKAMLAAAGPGRVGFKIRLGWNREEENYLELGAALQEAGAGWVTLHPRYARQLFTGSADWAAIGRLAALLNIPVLASGDLSDAQAALRCLRQSGAAGVMFGRGALHNPAVFSSFLEALASPAEDKSPQSAMEPQALKKLVYRHAELARAMPVPERFFHKEGALRPEMALLKMRGAIPRYVRDLPGSKIFRQALSSCEAWDEFYELVENFFNSVGVEGCK